MEALNKDLRLSFNLVIHYHNLIKNCQLYTLDKLASNEVYNISLCSMYKKPNHKATLNNYFKQKIWTGKKYTFY